MASCESILVVGPFGSEVDGASVLNAALVRELSIDHRVTLVTFGSPVGDFGSARIMQIPARTRPPPVLVEGIRSEVRSAIRDGGFLDLLGADEDFTIIIGHDWTSTREVNEFRDRYFPSARTVGIFHTVPQRLFEVWGDPATGEVMADVQRQCLTQVDLGVGVGPFITSSLNDLATDGSGRLVCDIHELIPGFTADPSARPSKAPGHLRLLALGRYEDPSKGMPSAIRAVSMARSVGVQVSLEVRGFPKEVVPHVQRELDEAFDLGGAVQVLPSTRERDRVDKDVHASDAGIVPSLFEAFSMAAMEFLERGRPILITRDSGFAEFLCSCAGDPSGPSSAVVEKFIIFDRGGHLSRFPRWNFPPPGASRDFLWARGIEWISRSYEDALSAVSELQEFLVRFTWRDAAMVLVERISEISGSCSGPKESVCLATRQGPGAVLRTLY